MIPFDKFNNPIYPNIFKILKEVGICLINIGYKENNPNKQNLFTKEDDDLIEKRKKARELLNLDENENDLDVIDKQFKIMARELHPDMENGSTEKFKKLNEAHKILRKEVS